MSKNYDNKAIHKSLLDAAELIDKKDDLVRTFSEQYESYPEFSGVIYVNSNWLDSRKCRLPILGHYIDGLKVKIIMTMLSDPDKAEELVRYKDFLVNIYEKRLKSEGLSQ